MVFQFTVSLVLHALPNDGEDGGGDGGGSLLFAGGDRCAGCGCAIVDDLVEVVVVSYRCYILVIPILFRCSVEEVV